jgi:hypothetical protein
MDIQQSLVPKTLMEIINGAWHSEMLNTSIDIGIFDFLEEKGSATPEDVSSALKLNPTMTKDLLAGLAA